MQVQLQSFVVLVSLVAVNSPGQSTQTNSFPYVLKNFAGSFPLGDGGPAASALLYTPTAVALDGSGDIFILDSNNYRIRKITPDGTITTAVQLETYGNDLKVGPDGSFYLTSAALVTKINPNAGVAPYGQVTVIAGTGNAGTSGDGVPANTANLSSNTGGVALDKTGNIYFVDGNRVRQVTTDGLIHTVAGTGTAGYNGDNQTAVTAQLNQPWGLAVDSSNNLYIADQFNSRVRKVSNGGITTIAGNGTLGTAVDGPATATPLGTPFGLTVDSSGNVYITDIGLFWAIKISATGNLSHVAGNGPGTVDFGYSDGAATGSYLDYPAGLAVDGSGNLYITELNGNRVRQVAAGNLSTFAGKLHYAGDGGPAVSALLNYPIDVALDGKGNAFITDSANYRIREVLTNGTINTVAGTGIPDTPDDGSQASSAPLPDMWAMANDASGNLYLATTHKVLEISAAGVVSTVAGTGGFGDTGDGGPANKATFEFLTGIAVDGAGNIYVADSETNRIRKISAADGSISAFAGTGKTGYFGDNGPAASAMLNLYYSYPAPMAVDAHGNVYIGDFGNSVVRMVNSSGLITTVAGTGKFGGPVNGAAAKSSMLSSPYGLTLDSLGNLYIVAALYSAIYRVDTSGTIQQISGGGSAAPADGLLATASAGFSGGGIRADANLDLYVADPSGMIARKLVYNSPLGVSIVSGNNQSGPAGLTLPAPVVVAVNGRAGTGVAGATVNFSVTSGAATLSANSATADVNGMAQMTVTLGPLGAAGSGTVIITAAVAGSNVPPVSFTLFATQPNPNCPIAAPAITSVRSSTDFGGLPSFASGSWLEVKGSNLATDSRSWTGADFLAGATPTSLDGTSVTIDGIPAYVSYISPQQVNVLAPADPATGQVQVTATNCAGTSAAYAIQKNTLAPGLLAPASFNLGGKQYLAATLPDGVTYVGSPGYNATKPGDLLQTYGIGFGPVNPPVSAGAAATQPDAIPNFTLAFGSTPAAVSYAGLAPGVIGIYQFNFTTPNVPSGDYQIVVNAGTTAVQQTVYLTVAGN